MTERAGRTFAAELTRFAAEVCDPRVTAIAEHTAAAVRVAVCGRRGVGRRTVAHALGCAGTVITPRPADITVYVLTEAVKPEDTAAVAAAPRPVVVTLNKADLGGHAPLATVSARLGEPVEPMSALLAVAALDSRDDQVDGAATLLRRLSGVDAVLRRLDAAGATVRYRRLLDAVTRLTALAVGDSRIGGFLASDATVLARMAAALDAVAVVAAAGQPVEPADDAAAQLRRAVHWQRYRNGPADDVQRACGADIARGSLRLWGRAGGRCERD